MTISNQAFFNKVKKHLLTQKKRCIVGEPGTSCMYIDEDSGLRCAIGGSLPKKAIKAILENSDNCSHFSEIATLSAVKPYLPSDTNLISDLQECHDLEQPKNWARLLKNIAKAHGLTYERKQS
jgi:hypothetical protein